MEISVQQPDRDLFIDELVKNITDEFKNTCIRIIDRKHQKLRLMSYPMACYFLTNIGVRDGNLHPNEASSLAYSMIKYYKPSSVTDEEIQNDEYNYGYNQLEFKRLFVQYLVVCCNIDPLEAMKHREAVQFWQKFFPEKEEESAVFMLPVLNGGANEVNRAVEIQRKQIEDLIILKNHINSHIEPLNRKYVEEACTNESDKEKSWFDYERKIEIVIAHIDSIINRELAEDWLASDSVFKYTIQWLEQILVTVVKEIGEITAAETSQPVCYSINYPVLLCNQELVLKIDTESDWNISINEDFRYRLGRIYLNTLEVIEPAVVEFCLVMIGIEAGGMEVDKAHKLAKKAINSWSCKPKLKINKVYTKSELNVICRNYLANCCNFYSPRILKYLIKFWQALFPNTGQFIDSLPKLLGTPSQIKMAENIRNMQIEGLFDLERFLADSTGSLDSMLAELPQDLHSNIDIVAHLNKIIMRKQATDWLDTSSIVYDAQWLRQEVDKLWLVAKDDWQARKGEIQSLSQEKVMSLVSDSSVAIDSTRTPVQQSVQGYEVNILMIGKLRGEVKVIRGAKDDGIRLVGNDIDLRALEFDVKEHRLMCLEAMKKLVKAGYFELDSIALNPGNVPKESKTAIKTYKIMAKGRAAPMLTPLMGNVV